MATVIPHDVTEKCAVPDFYEEPSPVPAGESTMSTELPGKILAGTLIGLLGAAVGVAMAWIPIASGATYALVSILPQIAMTVMIVTGYALGMYFIAKDEGKG